MVPGAADSKKPFDIMSEVWSGISQAQRDKLVAEFPERVAKRDAELLAAFERTAHDVGQPAVVSLEAYIPIMPIQRALLEHRKKVVESRLSFNEAVA